MTQSMRESTTVVIVGGGVSGLTAAMLLRSCGVASVVLEKQSRPYVEQRQRAGVVEYRGVRMFEQWGLGELLGSFPANDNLEVLVEGDSRLLRSSTAEAAGQAVPQQALVRALIGAFLAGGGDLRFESAGVAVRGLDTPRPVVTYTGPDEESSEIECDFVAGCDGDRGVCNSCVPAGAIAAYGLDYGISWLTVLAAAPPPENPLMAVSSHGYAAHFARGPRASRFYLQCDPADTPGDWPAERIWKQLRLRMHRPDLPGGRITETEVFPLRCLVREPMTYGRLYLLGDAAHVISPMGAKGMNIALYDAEIFATAVRDFINGGDETGLQSYSDVCLARTWRYQEFSHWQTGMMHDMSGPDPDPFRARLARARFDWALSSPAGSRYYTDMITGLG